MRTWLQQWHYARFRQLSLRSTATDLKHSAIVFSPHQDDETLGCGGTVLRKKQAGAEIQIVFMADGAGSHPNLMPADVMISLRQKEAIAAAKQLGLEAHNVIFLGLQDGALSEQQAIARQKVAAILTQYQPEAVYIPYYQDRHPDHVATHRAVMAALQDYGRPIVIWEYPVWFWTYWPWIRTSYQAGGRLKRCQQILMDNLALIKDFNRSVPIADLLDLKQAALEQHESQVKPLRSDPDWITLGDVFEGDFLKCFFREYEIFYCHQYSNPQDSLRT